MWFGQPEAPLPLPAGQPPAQRRRAPPEQPRPRPAKRARRPPPEDPAAGREDCAGRCLVRSGGSLCALPYALRSLTRTPEEESDELLLVELLSAGGPGWLENPAVEFALKERADGPVRVPLSALRALVRRRVDMGSASASPAALKRAYRPHKAPCGTVVVMVPLADISLEHGGR